MSPGVPLSDSKCKPLFSKRPRKEKQNMYNKNIFFSHKCEKRERKSFAPALNGYHNIGHIILPSAGDKRTGKLITRI